jgi:large subunit ribosomal protein L24
MAGINPKLINVSKNRRTKMVSAPMADSLREAYKKKTLRVIRGDSVKVVRGEYKGVEGKVDNVDIEHGTLNIEGVQREKIKGGQVKVPIHASNVIIVNLNLEDKYRSNKVQGDKPKAPKPEVRAESKASDTPAEKGADE